LCVREWLPGRKGQRGPSEEQETHPREELKKNLQISIFFFTEDPLVGAIAQQLLTDREGHDKTAAEWTRRYAQG
jgi:hypothetical protein